MSKALPTLATTAFGTPQERRAAAESWLSRSAAIVAGEDSQVCGVVLRTAGISWDAVRVPYTALDPAFGPGTTPDSLRGALVRLRLTGPVFCDPYRGFLYVMVPPGTDQRWPSALVDSGLECLGRSFRTAHYVGVPVLDRTELPGPCWVVPPDTVAFRHVDPQRLRQVLDARTAEVPS